jgi:hypothetical protein
MNTIDVIQKLKDHSPVKAGNTNDLELEMGFMSLFGQGLPKEERHSNQDP